MSWALLPLIPVAVLSEKIGRGILFAAGLFPFAYAGHALGAKRAALTLFLLSPKVSHDLLNLNIEWLSFMGVILSTLSRTVLGHDQASKRPRRVAGDLIQEGRNRRCTFPVA